MNKKVTIQIELVLTPHIPEVQHSVIRDICYAAKDQANHHIRNGLLKTIKITELNESNPLK